MGKVLIGAPINQRKQYSLDRYIDSVRRITHHNKSYFFCDNSQDSKWHIKNFIFRYGMDCEYVYPSGKNNEYITKSQNIIVNKALTENYDWLLFIECDIYVHPAIIEELLSYNKPVAAARYFYGEGEPTGIYGTEIENTFGERLQRGMAQWEGFLEWGTGNTKSDMFGFGCVMIHRSILEAMGELYIQEESETHSDTYFWLWCKENKVPIAVCDKFLEHDNRSWISVTDYKN